MSANLLLYKGMDSVFDPNNYNHIGNFLGRQDTYYTRTNAPGPGYLNWCITDAYWQSIRSELTTLMIDSPDGSTVFDLTQRMNIINFKTLSSIYPFSLPQITTTGPTGVVASVWMWDENNTVGNLGEGGDYSGLVFYNPNVPDYFMIYSRSTSIWEPKTWSGDYLTMNTFDMYVK